MSPAALQEHSQPRADVAERRVARIKPAINPVWLLNGAIAVGCALLLVGPVRGYERDRRARAPVVPARTRRRGDRALAGASGVPPQRALVLADGRARHARAVVLRGSRRGRRDRRRQRRRARPAPVAAAQVRLQPHAVRVRDGARLRRRACDRRSGRGVRATGLVRRARRAAARRAGHDRADRCRDVDDGGITQPRADPADVRDGRGRHGDEHEPWPCCSP